MREKIIDNWLTLFWEDEVLRNELDIITKALDAFPPRDKLPAEGYFKAMSFRNPEEIQVVILGQDPYHNVKDGKCSATGIAFQDRLKDVGHNAPSLRNLERKLGHKIDFLFTSLQGVLWLNTALSVAEGKPNSHKKLWAKFTKRLIKRLAELNPNIVWVLMGGNALSYKETIEENGRDGVFIICSHPSPLSCRRKLKNYPAFEDINIFEEITKLTNISFV